MIGLLMLFALSFDPAAAPIAPEKDKKVCRSMDPEVGSRLGARRICKRESDWRAEDAETQRGLRTLDERSRDFIPTNNRGSGAQTLGQQPG